MPLDPQFDAILAPMSQMPSLADIPIETVRSMPIPPNPSPTPVDEVFDRRVPGPGGDVPVRIYRKGARGKLPLLVFIHGGGFVVGGVDTHDEPARMLTAELNSVTVSVDYRLAPEAPFPAATDDCFAALEWAAAEAVSLGADPGRIVVVGDSAGGNLAAVTALRARDEDGPALAAQVLVYPVVDMRLPLQASPDGAFHVIGPKDADFYHRSYVPDPALMDNPHASPALADSHQGLPPAFIITAEYDPLVAQGKVYEDKLKAAGVSVDHRCYAGAIHGFLSFPAPMAAQGAKDIADWLKARLG